MAETEENPKVDPRVGLKVAPKVDPEVVPEVAPEVGGVLAAEIPTIPSWTRTKNLTQSERNAIFYKLLQRVSSGCPASWSSQTVHTLMLLILDISTLSKVSKKKRHL